MQKPMCPPATWRQTAAQDGQEFRTMAHAQTSRLSGRSNPSSATRPVIDDGHFPDLKAFTENWQSIRAEAEADPAIPGCDPGLPRCLTRPAQDFNGKELAHLHICIGFGEQAGEELRPGPLHGEAASQTCHTSANRLVLDPQSRLSHPGPSRREQGNPARPPWAHHSEGCRKVPHPRGRRDQGLAAGRVVCLRRHLRT